MKYLLIACAYVVSLVLTATAASLALIYLVGPHGGVLPQGFYIPLLGLGWALVIVVPVISARWMWRYLSKAIHEASR